MNAVTRCLFQFMCLFWVSSATAALNHSVTFLKAVKDQVGTTTGYDPAYVKLAYPGGDVPLHTGVCSDVVVRGLRACGLDLQKAVHEDMRKAFDQYPKKWGLKKPDPNIDHRRVLNIMKYLERQHITLKEKQRAPDVYKPGDIVAWNLGKGVTHIGVVSDRKRGNIPLVLHNIGSGVMEENILFEYEIIGHYRMQWAQDSADESVRDR